jgi:excinuclease UvrABC ATPase subunit
MQWRANSTAPRSCLIASRLEHIDKIIDIDQSPIGTPREPATARLYNP